MTDRHYPTLRTDPRELRPRRSNKIAAFALVASLVVAIIVIAVLG